MNFKSTQEQMLGNAQVPIEHYQQPVELPQIYNIPQDWQQKSAKEKIKNRGKFPRFNNFVILT